MAKKTIVKRSRKAKARKRKTKDRPKAIERAKPSTLNAWMAGVRALATSAKSASKPRGACLVANPAGGARMCIVTDRDTCKAIKGTFVGGPC